MDRILLDCMVLSIGIALALGSVMYFGGPKILAIYNKDPEVIHAGMEVLSYTTLTYFLCGLMDLFPGALRGMGRSGVPMLLSIIGTVGIRVLWIFAIFPGTQKCSSAFRILPGILDRNDFHASDLLLFCP